MPPPWKTRPGVVLETPSAPPAEPERGVRVVYGARCMWWGLITEASALPSGLPCTPCCGSPMFEVEDLAAWWAQVDGYERESGKRGYRAFIEWLRGRCHPSMEDAMQAFYDAGHAEMS